MVKIKFSYNLNDIYLNIFSDEFDGKKYLEIYLLNKSDSEFENYKIYLSGMCEYMYSHEKIESRNNYREINLEKMEGGFYKCTVEWNFLNLKFYIEYNLKDSILITSKKYEINYLKFKKNKKTWNDSIYFIMIDRFKENYNENQWINDDYYIGGTFDNILNDLPRIVEDGYSIVYLSPIMESFSYHGYNPISFDRISTVMGGEKGLVNLSEEMKKYNIKLGIELVLNHASVFSKLFKDCLKGDNDLFYIKNNGEYEIYRDCLDLAKIKYNYQNRKVILEKNVNIINKLNIQFIRLDCCNYLDEFFVNELASFCEEKKSILIGECWNDYTNFFNHYLVDGATNYKLYGNMKQFFIEKSISVKDFQDRLIKDLFENGSMINGSMLNFLDNQDIDRISNLATEKILLEMLNFLFIYIGVPMIYYGTENYDENIKKISINRRCFFRENINEEIQERIKKLNFIRKKFISNKVSFESTEEILVFSREIDSGTVRYIYNNSDNDLVIFGKNIIKNSSKIIICH